MDDVSRFDTNYQKQLLFNFSAARATRKKSAATINARASRLRDIDLDVAPITFSRDTTDRHELSRYVFEDLLSCPVGSRIVVCIRSGVEGDPTETSYSDQAKCITSCRSESEIATESWRMAGNQYLVLQGKLFRSTMHDEVMSGNLSQSRFEKCFANLSGDFGISFEGTKNILSVPWCNVVQYCNVVMFFGKQFDQTRPWGPVFRFKNDPEYAHHVFRSFASEYFGDLRASSQLFAVYKECMCTIYREHSLLVASALSNKLRAKMATFGTDRARTFQATNCFSKFNDYTMPILHTFDFTNFQNQSKKVFPEEWTFLSLHCNVNEDRDGPVLTAFKERQVFITVLLLLRQSNFRSLPHWFLILSTAMYGWGTRDTLGHVTSFIGTTVSRSY